MGAGKLRSNLIYSARTTAYYEGYVPRDVFLKAIDATNRPAADDSDFHELASYARGGALFAYRRQGPLSRVAEGDLQSP